MILGMILCSCSPSNLFFVDSQAIWEYNRATGKMKLVWKFKTYKNDTIWSEHTIVYPNVDSVVVKQ